MGRGGKKWKGMPRAYSCPHCRKPYAVKENLDAHVKGCKAFLDCQKRIQEGKQ